MPVVEAVLNQWDFGGEELALGELSSTQLAGLQQSASAAAWIANATAQAMAAATGAGAMSVLALELRTGVLSGAGVGAVAATGQSTSQGVVEAAGLSFLVGAGAAFTQTTWSSDSVGALTGTAAIVQPGALLPPQWDTGADEIALGELASGELAGLWPVVSRAAFDGVPVLPGTVAAAGLAAVDVASVSLRTGVLSADGVSVVAIEGSSTAQSVFAAAGVAEVDWVPKAILTDSLVDSYYIVPRGEENRTAVWR